MTRPMSLQNREYNDGGVRIEGHDRYQSHGSGCTIHELCYNAAHRSSLTFYIDICLHHTLYQIIVKPFIVMTVADYTSPKRDRTDDDTPSETTASSPKKAKLNPTNTTTGIHGVQTMTNGADDHDGAEFFDQPAGITSFQIIDADGTDIEADDEAPSMVFESAIVLRPQCWKHHAGFKGKGRENDKISRHFPWSLCGRYNACHAPHFNPRSARPTALRFKTDDPLQDLKRWMTTLNESLSGGMEDRENTGFLKDERFTHEILRQGLRYAVDRCQDEHEIMSDLDDYGRRDPYRINLKHVPLAPEADQGYFDVTDEEDFTSVKTRQQLRTMVENSAIELDYLRQMSEQHAARILRRKMALAKMGNKWEADTLLKQEYVTEEWVEDECWSL